MKCPVFSSRVTKIRAKLAIIISSEGMSLAPQEGLKKAFETHFGLVESLRPILNVRIHSKVYRLIYRELEAIFGMTTMDN